METNTCNSSVFSHDQCSWMKERKRTRHKTWCQFATIISSQANSFLIQRENIGSERITEFLGAFFETKEWKNHVSIRNVDDFCGYIAVLIIWYFLINPTFMICAKPQIILYQSSSIVFGCVLFCWHLILITIEWRRDCRQDWSKTNILIG